MIRKRFEDLQIRKLARCIGFKLKIKGIPSSYGMSNDVYLFMNMNTYKKLLSEALAGLTFMVKLKVLKYIIIIRSLVKLLRGFQHIADPSNGYFYETTKKHR